MVSLEHLMRYTNHMITETKSCLAELHAKMYGFPNYFEEITLLTVSGLARRSSSYGLRYEIKSHMGSSPSLRSGAMASEVALPVQFSKLKLGFWFRNESGLARRSPPNKFRSEEDSWKAKPAFAPRRSFGGRSRGGQIRTDDLGAPWRHAISA